MALSFTGSGSSTNATAPSPTGSAKAGDFVCVVASRNAATAPTVPGGWTTLGSSATSPAMVVAGKIWDGAALGTFTNATSCISIAWTGYDVASTYGAFASGIGTSTTITYPALTTQITNGTSHVVRATADIRPDVVIPTPTSHTLIFATASRAIQPTHLRKRRRATCRHLFQ